MPITDNSLLFPSNCSRPNRSFVVYLGEGKFFIRTVTMRVLQKEKATAMKTLLHKITSRGALIIIIVGLTLLFVLLYSAVSQNCYVNFSPKGFTIIPKGQSRIEELEKKLKESVTLSEYNKLENYVEQLEKENRNFQLKYIKLKNASGANIEESDDNVVKRMYTLMSNISRAEENIEYSMVTIRNKLDLNVTVNTNSKAMNLELSKHIQKVLKSLGIYNGEIDGDQIETREAVIEFQTKFGLSVDGIIGDNTYSAMRCAIDEAKNH